MAWLMKVIITAVIFRLVNRVMDNYDMGLLA